VNDDAFRFLNAGQIAYLHEMAINQDGGEPGLRDSGNLEMSALAPRNLAYYQSVDAFDVPAAYAHSITRNHPFEDANKRTALTAALVFLGCNGLSNHHFDETELERAVIYLTTREMTRSSFAQFLRDAFDGTPGDWIDDPENRQD